MKKNARVPAIWRELFAGDCFITRRSYRALVSQAETMKEEGYEYTIENAPAGHRIVRCTKSPLETYADGFAMLTGRDQE